MQEIADHGGDPEDRERNVNRLVLKAIVTALAEGKAAMDRMRREKEDAEREDLTFRTKSSS